MHSKRFSRPQPTWWHAPRVSLGASPDGMNINKGVGATHPDYLSEMVLKHEADLGIAVDGDADRLVLCDERGEVIDGVDDDLRIVERHVPGTASLHARPIEFVPAGDVALTFRHAPLVEGFVAAEALDDGEAGLKKLAQAAAAAMPRARAVAVTGAGHLGPLLLDVDLIAATVGEFDHLALVDNGPDGAAEFPGFAVVVRVNGV